MQMYEGPVLCLAAEQIFISTSSRADMHGQSCSMGAVLGQPLRTPELETSEAFTEQELTIRVSLRLKFAGSYLVSPDFPNSSLRTCEVGYLLHLGTLGALSLPVPVAIFSEGFKCDPEQPAQGRSAETGPLLLLLCVGVCVCIARKILSVPF